jgi:alpha-tubulin suppressor-like RCC1 family protein
LNDKGQLGDGTTVDSPVPVQVAGPAGGSLTAASVVSAGEGSTCVITSPAQVWCWGLNNKGQLGNNTTADSPVPVQVVGPGGVGVLSGALTISSGLTHSCVLSSGASVWCWGRNDKGQLGDGTTADSWFPVPVVGSGGIGSLSGATAVGTGTSHSCAARNDDTVWCWGLNSDRQLGNNTDVDSAIPVQAIGV